MKPTPEQVAAARAWFDPLHLRDIRQQRAITADMIEILLAATAPEPGPPRPNDEIELARQVAKELRNRAVQADYSSWFVLVLRWRSKLDNERSSPGRLFSYNMRKPDFDKLTPREIADVIQREEAKHAKEWANDK